jgi:hypothetical protein
MLSAALIVLAATSLGGSSNVRVCIEREGQNGSLNIAPTILSVRARASHTIIARKRLDDGGSLCAVVPRGRYVLIVRLAEPWTGSVPPRWWTRTFPLDLRRGDARYIMTNPPTNNQFQAMISGPNGWHRLWPVHRVR